LCRQAKFQESANVIISNSCKCVVKPHLAQHVAVALAEPMWKKFNDTYLCGCLMSEDEKYPVPSKDVA